MYTEILTFGEYTYFVWSAFIFTFLTCFILFLKTKNDLAKQEKLYLYMGLSIIRYRNYGKAMEAEPNKNNIVTHMLEYDNYIRAKNSTTSDKVFVKKEPIIFIDQALDHNSDFINHGKNYIF